MLIARLCVASLVREIHLLVAKPSRLVAVVGFPLIIWVFLQLGLGQSSLTPGVAFGSYVLPGVLTLVVALQVVVGSIGLIQARDSGLLAGLLTITGRGRFLVSLVVSSSLMALLQATLLLPLFWLEGVSPTSAASLVAGLAACWALALGVAGWSIAIAARITSVAGFHGIMNLVIMPAWLLSGGITPPDAGSRVLQGSMMINPFASAAGLVRSACDLPHGAGAIGWIPLALLAVSGLAATALSARSLEA